MRRNYHRRREESCEMVPVAPFRERFLEMQTRGEMTLSELCIHVGWVYRPAPSRLQAERRRPGSIKADTSRASRVLGLSRRPDCMVHQEHINYEQGVRLMRALGMDPHEAGL
jgi:hypothetical protein